MGIPSYFSYIVKNHPAIIKKYVKNVLKVDNLYLDCNSIVYDAYNKIVFENLTENVSISIIKSVISKIEYYIKTIEPTRTVYIAFDGVAPVAKLDQQRSRRYKSWYQNDISRKIFKKVNPDPWSTTAITPGTKFMNDLNISISDTFKKHNAIKYNVNNIICSGSNIAGEGEHKIYEYIRKNPIKHASETTVIYGLDADLIMLSINHLPISPKIYLFRETPHFIGSINADLEPDQNYVMDIPELSNAIIKYMNNDIELTTKQQTNRIYDYIFLSFFLGNDFLPHFPTLNIRTGGIDKMLNAYKATIGNTDENLTDGKTIFWGNVRKMLSFLEEREEEYYIVEHKLRNKRENKNMPEYTPEEKFKKFEAIPTYDRDIEYFINPVKPNWQKRYYKALFNFSEKEINEAKRKEVAINYLEGLEWTMKYYTSGCVDWRWKYRYNYPPLLSDLLSVTPVFEKQFLEINNANPVSELVQLCYVLPRSNLNLLPSKLHNKLIQNYEHWYKNDCEYVWAYCRYFWESHVEMDDIDIDELEKFIKENRDLLN